MRIRMIGLLLALFVTTAPAEAADYRVLATSKTSTMQKEMNEAASAGFQYDSAMGGKTSGGNEVVVIMSRDPESFPRRMEYRLLATSKTSTMQREIQQAGDAGFRYRGQTVFETAFGGEEVVVILERDQDAPRRRFEYRLLASTRTSTMEKELQQAAARGFELVGMTVGKTAFGGAEVVTIVRKELAVAER